MKTERIHREKIKKQKQKRKISIKHNEKGKNKTNKSKLKVKFEESEHSSIKEDIHNEFDNQNYEDLMKQSFFFKSEEKDLVQSLEKTEISTTANDLTIVVEMKRNFKLEEKLVEYEKDNLNETLNLSSLEITRAAIRTSFGVTQSKYNLVPYQSQFSIIKVLTETIDTELTTRFKLIKFAKIKPKQLCEIRVFANSNVEHLL
ncbi:hypothetical protein I4U23_010699 [Adineta vaga]|nr:hypothetical protein I4U23_010699 [Adineta vaga]